MRAVKIMWAALVGWVNSWVYPQQTHSMEIKPGSVKRFHPSDDFTWAEGLPNVGEDHLALMATAVEMYPESDLAPNQRYNRRRWMESIHYLRTQTTSGWVQDRRVEKSEAPTKDATAPFVLAKYSTKSQQHQRPSVRRLRMVTR